MDSMVDQMAQKPNQPAPAAATPSQPPSQAPTPAALPQQSDSDRFKSGLDNMVDSAMISQAPPQLTPGAKAGMAQSDAQKELEHKQAIAKHGLLSRAWDWVNQPIFDNVLPEGIKTADIIKAGAFEKLYGEAYIPGINDFDTKAETHFGMKNGKAVNEKENINNQKGAIRKFLENHTAGFSEALLNKEGRRAFANGSAGDTANVAAGFTSPLSVATLGLGSEEVQGAKGVGTIAKAVSPFVGTAFGLQGLYQGAHGGMDIYQNGATPENTQELLGGLGQAALAGAAGAKDLSQRGAALREKVTPVMKDVDGNQIPVRQEGQGVLADAAQKAVDPSVHAEAASNTEGAVKQAVGDTTGKAVGSRAGTEINDQDRLGIRSHANDMREQSVPAMKELDRVSNNAFSDAQDMADNSRNDFTTEGRQKYKEALAHQDAIIDEHRDELAKAGLDVDSMKGNYRKAIALEKIATAFDTATGPGENGGYTVDGDKLAKQIDRLRRMPDEKNQFVKAGFTPEHIDTLAELAKTLKEQQVAPEFGTMAKFAAKAIPFIAASHGGIGAIAEAMLGKTVGEHVIGTAMTRFLGDAMTSAPAAKEINAAMQNPQTLSMSERFKGYLQKAYDAYKASPLSSEKGAVGADINKPVKRLGGDPGDMKVTRREDGAWQFDHPNGTSQMILKPEADSRPGFEGKKQLRQTGISAVDAPGAGQQMMDEAVNRMNKTSAYSRIVSDHPDLRSPENEGHWGKLERRGYDVQHAPVNDSDGMPTEQGGGVEHFIPKQGEPAGSVTEGHNPDSEISTRPAGENNPTEHKTGWDAIEQAEQQKPGHMAKLLDEVQKYPELGINLTPEDMANPRQGLQKVVDRWSGNLEWLHNQIPPEIREISKLWYDSAHQMATKWADQYGVSKEKVSGVIAALSPKNAWDVNAGQARRMLDMFVNQRGHEWSPEMDATLSKIRNGKGIKPDFRAELDKLRGKTFDELNDPENPDATNFSQALWMRILDQAHGSPHTELYAPNGDVRGHITMQWGMPAPMAKALDMLKSDGTPAAIHDIIGDGHKIRNFYNNIVSPNSPEGHATIDTHAANADMLIPRGSDDPEIKGVFGGAPANKATGQKGMYSLHHAAYAEAAKRIGILPRELQSITWEGVKALMGDDKKTPELRKAVTDIWSQHMAGDLTIDQARAKIVEAAKGFTRPAWLTGSKAAGGE